MAKVKLTPVVVKLGGKGKKPLTVPCKRNHPIEQLFVNVRGDRLCRDCRSESAKAYYERHREKVIQLSLDTYYRKRAEEKREKLQGPQA